MTAPTTPTTAPGPASAPAAGPSWMDFAKVTAAATAITATGALVLNNVSNWIVPSDFGAGISDASNWKVFGSSLIVGPAAVVGYAVPKQDMGVQPGATVAGVGSAAALGYGVGNWFTGGWLEKGSVSMGLAGAAIAGGYSVLNAVKNKRASGSSSSRTPGARRGAGAWNKVKGAFEKVTRGNKDVQKGLGAGAVALAVTGASNILNWPSGGFNKVGMAAGAVIAGVTVGGFGYAKERYDDMDDKGKKRTKIAAIGLGAAAIAGGYFAWKHGIIAGHGHGKSSDHIDKIPAGKGSTTTTEAATTTSTTAVSATSVPSGSGGSGSSFTLSSFSAANKPAMVEKITGMGVPAPKANTIADQILNGQYKAVTEHPEAFAKFVGGKNQAFADWAFQKDVAALAV